MNASLGRLWRWLHRQPIEEKTLNEAVYMTFRTEFGQRTMNYLLDTYYFSICATNDAGDLAAHNGARAVLQDLIEKYDKAENPNRNLESEVQL